MNEVNEAPPPSESTTHAVADWIELACIASPDGYFALEVLDAERKRQKDTGQASSSTAAEIVLSACDEPASYEFEDSEDDGILPFRGDQPARDASPVDLTLETTLATLPEPSLSTETSDILKHLRSREQTLGPARYPFTVIDRSLQLQSRLGAAQGIYIALLLCSNLNRLPEKKRNEWTSGFERYACHALAVWLGPQYLVEVFGTAANPGELFHGNTLKAIETLSNMTHWPVVLDADELAQMSTSGDRGLDGVAWRSRALDKADLWPVYFLQAGCGKEWPNKQDDTALTRWSRILGVKGPLQPVLAIPYWQRTTQGKWAKSASLSTQSVLLDRFRLLELAADVVAYLEFPTDRVQRAIIRDAYSQQCNISTAIPRRPRLNPPPARICAVKDIA